MYNIFSIGSGSGGHGEVVLNGRNHRAHELQEDEHVPF
jgi:hypothetical protein